MGGVSEVFGFFRDWLGGGGGGGKMGEENDWKMGCGGKGFLGSLLFLCILDAL